MLQAIIFNEGDTIDSTIKLTMLTKSQVDVHGCSSELLSVSAARLKVVLNVTKVTERSFQRLYRATFQQ